MENIPQLKEESALPAQPEKKETKLDFQDQITKLIPTAGTIEITEQQKEVLYAPVKDADVEIRPDGLIYLPWMEYVSRLKEAFGTGWAIIPQGMPTVKNDFILWPFWLVIQGKIASFAVGEQQYHANNPTMTYGDALEGAKSNALMRLCKGIGVSLELWRPSFIRKWKEKYAETYEKEDKYKNIKTYWRKKGEISNGIGDKQDTTKKPKPEEKPKPEDMEALKAKSEKKAAEYHDRLMKIKNFFELRNYWTKHGIEIKAALMPEHFQMIEKLKDSLKTKFEEKKESHEETGNR